MRRRATDCLQPSTPKAPTKTGLCQKKLAALLAESLANFQSASLKNTVPRIYHVFGAEIKGLYQSVGSPTVRARPVSVTVLGTRIIVSLVNMTHAYMHHSAPVLPPYRVIAESVTSVYLLAAEFERWLLLLVFARPTQIDSIPAAASTSCCFQPMHDGNTRSISEGRGQSETGEECQSPCAPSATGHRSPVYRHRHRHRSVPTSTTITRWKGASTSDVVLRRLFIDQSGFQPSPHVTGRANLTATAQPQYSWSMDVTQLVVEYGCDTVTRCNTRMAGPSAKYLNIRSATIKLLVRLPVLSRGPSLNGIISYAYPRIAPVRYRLALV
ncbi:hypothetical protein J6590_021568 [Homalodisca vitripennis]|nr:hypothetical protein J6590_021568 [Homalodisca vitripennis]